MPPVSNSQLTDLNTLKSWLKIGLSDNNVDGLLSRLIIASTGTFLRLVNRPKLLSESVTETYRGKNNFRLFLNLQPVTAVFSVSCNGQLLQPYSNSYQGGYSFDELGLNGINDRFYSNIEYSVMYTGGFSPVSPEAYAAEQGVISIATLWYKRKDHADQLGQQLGNQIMGRFVEDELPPETRVIINSLKRMTPFAT